MNQDLNNSMCKQLDSFYELANICHDVLFWETDESLKVIYANTALYNHTGLKPHDVLGKKLKDILQPDEINSWEKVLQTRTTYEGICFRVKSKNGEYLHLKVSGKAIISNNKIIGFLGLCTFQAENSITKKVIDNLQITNQTILNSITDALVIIDNNERLVVVSSAFNRLWGLKNGEIFLSSIEDTLDKMQNHLAYGHKHVSLSLNQRLTDSGESIDLLKFKDGRFIERKSTPYIRDNKTMGRCWYFTDISQHKNLVDKLEQLAFQDSLTTLYNRRWCENKLKQLLLTSKSNSLSFFYMDLDRFKIINDSCGHIYGDDVLKEISRLLVETVDKKSYLSRLGGDEFGLILINKSYAELLQIANSIMLSISNYTYKLNNKIFKLGISIGLVIVSEEDDFRSVFIHADEACYLSKQTGRNKCTVYNENKAEFKKTQTELKWYDAIQKALLQGKFELWCQSINDIKKPSSHYEVLLRMRTDKNKLFSPGLFMESADRFGMSFTIDKKVIELFCKFYYKNRDKVNKTMFSINLSGNSIGREDFLPYVLRTLNQYEVDCKNICFEITENEIINNIDKAMIFFEHVKNIGCKISLDDFGKGLTSFSYLKNIPFDFIKIDGQFIQELNNDKINSAIIKSIVYIAEVMGKKTIAEHIENQMQLLKVAALGVNYFQGYYFSKPHQITKLLE